MYYDACNPPPFEPGQVQRCCGGFAGEALAHTHLPTYGDSQKHAHHTVRYGEPNVDAQLSDAVADVAKSIEAEMEKLDKELRELSLDMHDHPEIMWEEDRTHDLFVKYLSGKADWKVSTRLWARHRIQGSLLAQGR